MRILCTNDDGINAPGIGIIEDVARQISDDVWVVAPESDQSGVAHSLSLNDPLRLREISPRHFAVRGTPTDCVIMAVRHIITDRRPDVVLSGVNRGRNVAEDVHYSGTIAGAIEGAILGIPAFALSQEFGVENRQNLPWETASTHAPAIIKQIFEAGVPPDTVVNINFPNCAAKDVRGVVVSRQGKRNLGFLKIEARQDGRGNDYFWIGFERAPAEMQPGVGTDLEVLARKCVSVTPLRLDLTDQAFSEKLAGVLKDRAPA
jgi:5'-nucleotidase